MNSDDYIHYESNFIFCEACGKEIGKESKTDDGIDYFCERCYEEIEQDINSIQRKDNKCKGDCCGK